MGRGSQAAAAEPSEAKARPVKLDAKAYQELWFTLARKDWTTIVVVPADAGVSSESIAKSLAAVGKQLSDVPVTAITVSSLEYGSALALADLQQHIDRDRPPPGRRSSTIETTATKVVDYDPAGRGDDGRDRDGPIPRTEALGFAPAARLIISIPAVVAEPLGLAATQHADAVLVAVAVGRSRLENVRRTVELIGRQRVAGCVLVR